MYWRQKSRELWLKDGDRNTKFFHIAAQIKKEKCSISSIHDSVSGALLTNGEDIKNEGVKFFSSLLTKNVNDHVNLIREREEILQSIPQLISLEENARLMSPFSINELKEVIFFMALDQAPGPDGLTTNFYQKYWDFIGIDILNSLEESRKSGGMLKNSNVTNIAIIPKKNSRITFSDF